MRLRKIRLAGFKSFVDPVTIEFPGDLIGVVGPNGCGKSNIIDAVRWVMGESSARQLRGELLADVVFNGAASRRPVGQASVELLFDNADGRACGRFADRGEISIRRLVNREGQSVYYLNGTRCRRRDVTDLFLGTGLGPRSYAIIEQGTVSRLIEAKPADLRGFLEEAAGISLYRERRRETESRMGQTNDNLARLTDVREELGKQLARLKRQAAQAERYTAFKKEERRLRSELLTLRWQVLQREAEAGSDSIGEQEVKLEAARSRQRAAEAKLERERAAHVRATERYNERYRASLEVRTEVGRAEEAVAQLRRQRAELHEALARGEGALAVARRETAADAARLEELEAQLLGQRSILDRAREDAAGAERGLEKAEGALAAFRAEHEGFRERRETHRRTADAVDASLSHQRARFDELGTRRARLEAERESLAGTTEGADLALAVQDLDRRSEEARRLLQERQAEIAGLRRKEAAAAGVLHECRERLESMSGRLASLEALQQAVLNRQSGEAAEWLEANGLAERPRLAHVIEVDPDWAYAVECVLGSRLEAVPVEDPGRYCAALGMLDRATVSLVAERGSGGPQSEGEDRLVSRVRAGRELVGRWLAGVGTAPTADVAMERSHGLAPHESIVAPDGTWVGPGWIRVFRRRDEEAGLLAREREIGALRDSLAAAVAEAEEQEAVLARVREALARSEAEREELEAAWTDANERYARLRSDHAARVAETEARSRRRSELARDLDEAGGVLAELAEAIEESERSASVLAEEGRRLASEGEEVSRSAATHEAAVRDARESAEEARRNVHEAALGLESTTVQVAALREAGLRSKARMGALQTDLEESGRRLAGIEEPIADAGKRLRERLESHRGVESALGEARETVESKENELKECERERSVCEAEAGRERSTRDELRLEWNAVLARRDAIAEQLAESGFEAKEIVSTLPAEADAAVWQERLAGVERRINRLGPINLAAVTEFETESERKRYLDSQHDDLTDALATLHDAIRKIDRETRARFKDTFARVGRGLEQIFPRLFGGGNAYLELTGDDLLDTGVTVMARPPGKRNTSIHLLSGGEKALAAIALVFAIFDLNPAPFCLLDEVDAPLDDANVDRFVDLVRELSERVQVVLVTHNKSSMEAMGQLIGVTMNEPGVSRLVSVDVGEALEMVAD